MKTQALCNGVEVPYSPRREYSEGERGTFVPNRNHPGYRPDMISYIIGPPFSGDTRITDYKDGIAHKLAKAKTKIEDKARDIADTVFAPLDNEDSSLNRLDTMAQTIDSTLYPTQAHRDWATVRSAARRIFSKYGANVEPHAGDTTKLHHFCDFLDLSVSLHVMRE